MSRITAFCAMFFLIASPTVLAGMSLSDDSLLVEAAKIVNIHSTNAQPFQLEADFTAQVNTPENGHITWKWAAENRWSKEIRMADYRQVSVRKGDTVYTTRNYPFIPLRVGELFDLLDVASTAREWEIKKVKRKTQSGVVSDCAEIRLRSHSHGEWNPRRELCVSDTTKEVQTEETKDDGTLRRKEFSDYQSFHEHRYPRQLKLSSNGSVLLKAQVLSLQEGSFTDADFEPPKGAVARRQCEDMSYPIALKTPDPIYPASVSRNRMMGTTTVSLTVLPDGSVDDIQLIESAGVAMNKATEETVKTWRFKPARCGNEPIAFDIHVEVNFRLQ